MSNTPKVGPVTSSAANSGVPKRDPLVNVSNDKRSNKPKPAKESLLSPASATEADKRERTLRKAKAAEANKGVIDSKPISRRRAKYKTTQGKLEALNKADAKKPSRTFKDDNEAVLFFNDIESKKHALIEGDIHSLTVHFSKSLTNTPKDKKNPVAMYHLGRICLKYLDDNDLKEKLPGKKASYIDGAIKWFQEAVDAITPSETEDTVHAESLHFLGTCYIFKADWMKSIDNEEKEKEFLKNARTAFDKAAASPDKSPFAAQVQFELAKLEKRLPSSVTPKLSEVKLATHLATALEINADKDHPSTLTSAEVKIAKANIPKIVVSAPKN